MNDTGFALQLNLPSGRRALMVGDASYRAMGRYRARIRYDYLVVTHHGAAFDGRAVLARSSQGQAVVSVGKGNVYKHPRAEALRKHKGWHFEFTSSHGRKPRGDRILGP